MPTNKLAWSSSEGSALALLRSSIDALLDPQVLLDAVTDSSGQIVDFLYRELNQATCDYLGLSREELLGRGVVQTMPAIKGTLLPGCIRCLATGEPLILNDFSYDNEVLHDTRRYDLRATRATQSSIALTWRDVTERFELAQRVAQAEERYRRSINNAAVGMCLATPEGRIVEANEALCRFFGYDASAMNGKYWQDFTAPEYLEEERDNVKGILDGRIDSYRMTKPYVHADGHPIWGELSVSAVRDERGKLENIVGLITDITDRVHADERNHILAQQLQRQNELLATSERNYRRLAANVGDVVVYVRDGRFVWVSPSVDSLLGAPAEYWVGREVREIFPRSDLAAWVARVKTVTMGGVVRERYRVRSVDGVIHWVDAHSKPFYDEDGRQDGSIATLRVIDDQLAAEQALEESRRLQTLAEDRYRRAMDHAAIAMCLVTPQGRLQEVNDAACRLFGYDVETLKQKTWQELTPPEYLDRESKNVTDLHEGRVDSFRMTKQYIHADGHLVWVDLSVSCLRDQEGRVENEVALITDITAEVEAREQMERRRQADANERLRRSVDQAAVGMCLLTPAGGVEEINHALCEFFGYDADTLKLKTWQEVTGPEYMEENLKSVNDILNGRIDSFQMINQYVHADGHLIWGDQSVSCIRDADGSVENFLIQVNDVTAVEREVRERLEFEEFISDAIAEGRLVAYAQPIIDARTGQVVEEELLVRLVRPDGHVMVPGEFLPQAQRFGTMATIDRFMVARAIELARTGRRVAVNLSADSINDPATISAIIEELRQAGDAAARLSFEITETTALASTDLAEQFSNDMRTLGCRLALDDFGTGFGTFTELRGMTLDTLKIDQSFVHDLLRNPQDESVVRAIVGTAKEFGLLTTAEGVEDTDTRTRLVELGVDQLQGYLIGRPAPATPSAATNN